MKTFLVALGVLFAACGVAVALVPSGFHCAPTAEAAVARLLAASTADVTASSVGGYRVVSLRTDAIHAKRYALVASCSDATRPLQSVEVPGQPTLSSRLPSVRVGDRVTVLAASGDSHMELMGRALDGGALSETIRVQMPKFGENFEAAAVIHGRVLGNNVVEVVR